MKTSAAAAVAAAAAAATAALKTRILTCHTEETNGMERQKQK